MQCSQSPHPLRPSPTCGTHPTHRGGALPLLTVAPGVLLEPLLILPQGILSLADNRLEVLGHSVIPHVESAGLVVICPVCKQGEGRET